MLPSFRLKMRVECEKDIFNFAKVMKNNNIPIRIYEIAPIPTLFEIDPRFPDRTVTFTVVLPFDETIIGTIINAMIEARINLHVAYQTLAKEEDYTGERDRSRGSEVEYITYY